MTLVGRLAIATILTCLALTGLAAVSAGPATAQAPRKMFRVGYLSPGSPSDAIRERRFEAFRQGLRDLGYVEGQTVAIEPRWAVDGTDDRYAALAAELVRAKVDVIFVAGGTGTRAVQRATRTIPIVMSAVIDPLGSGLVASLAHPEGNVTGLSIMATEMIGKQLELLKEAVPRISRVAILLNPVNPGTRPQVREAEAAARALGIRLQIVEARAAQDIDRGFAAMTAERAGAVLVAADPVFGNERRRIAELAVKGRLPSMSPLTGYAEAGGLMVYGPNFIDLDRRAATYVDRILKGAQPRDLPVEQPSNFELIINARTAKAIGLTLSAPLLLRANRVIE